MIEHTNANLIALSSDPRLEFILQLLFFNEPSTPTVCIGSYTSA